MTISTCTTGYIPPSAGDYFLAVGVKFTSFKMIESFLLLTVGFGHRFEINALGLSTMTLPAPEAGKVVTPIAQVQLALRATFVPDDGVFALTAQLTSNSFLLSPDCHLTGGFAFSTWFKGQYNGDFVLTVGGYHPSFKRPDHYPIVPRLGFNWNLDEYLALKGSAYFALTPSVIMAGGSLNAVWQKDEFKAWFDVSMNFLVGWQPYHYEANFHLGIGASYTDTTFGRHEYTAHVSADVKIWGPEFQGEADVDLTVVSFKVRFGGESKARIAPLTWDEFKTAMLPKDLCTLSLAGGAIHKAQAIDDVTTDSTDLGAINPKDLFIIAETSIPSTQVKKTNSQDLPVNNMTTSINIGPVQTIQSIIPLVIRPASLTSTLSIFIMSSTENDDNEDISYKFEYRPILRNLPFAHWGNWGGKLKPGVSDDLLVENLLTGYEIRAKQPEEPISVQVIPRHALQNLTAIVRREFNWVPQKTFEASQIANVQTQINDTLSKANTTYSVIADLLPDIQIHHAQRHSITFYADPSIIKS